MEGSDRKEETKKEEGGMNKGTREGRRRNPTRYLRSAAIHAGCCSFSCAVASFAFLSCSKDAGVLHHLKKCSKSTLLDEPPEIYGDVYFVDTEVPLIGSYDLFFFFLFTSFAHLSKSI